MARFDAAWFERHQKALVYFANTSFGRWFLCMKEKSVPKSSVVSRIGTDFADYDEHVIWRNGKPFIERTTTWQAAPLYRLRFEMAYQYLRSFIPAVTLSGMFDSLHPTFPIALGLVGLTTHTWQYNTGGGDGAMLGYAQNSGVNSTWATIIAANGNGHFNVTSGAGNWQCVEIQASGTTNQFIKNTRGFLAWNTSSAGAGATASSGTMAIDSAGKADDLSCTPNINLYGHSSASNTSIADGDYQTVGSTAYSTNVAYSSWPSGGVNVSFTLNSSGLSAFVPTGYTKICFRNQNYDVAAVQPNWVSNAVSSLQVQAGYATPDYAQLTYTYSLPMPFKEGFQTNQAPIRAAFI